MEKILISACLIGDKTRYDGKSSYHPLVKELLKKYELIPFCPEVEGGLPTPRKPSEIIEDKVMMSNGKDVTKNYTLGAEKALNICKALNIKIAILKDGSPSCGSKKIHDGKFTGHTISGNGVTTKLLRKHHIEVLSEEDIEAFLNN